MRALAVASLVALVQAAGAETLTYRVGPGDVLEVMVDGRPDLSRLPTVQTTGSVFLPRAGEVQVRGLSTAEIAARLTPLLAGDDLASPRVAVRVREYQSQFVWVRGAVQRPGRKPLRSGTRLLDALLDAGGFQEGASGEVTVERTAGTFADGSHAAHFRFAGTTPTPEELDELGMSLQGGDVIIAGVQRWVSVTGAVKSPGRRPFVDTLTLVQLVDAAGGIARGGSERVVLRRAGGESEADLRAIREGKAQDVALLAGDEVVVRARRP
jgi:protein involved in polysaccharide export with SLBB domain